MEKGSRICFVNEVLVRLTSTPQSCLLDRRADGLLAASLIRRLSYNTTIQILTTRRSYYLQVY